MILEIQSKEELLDYLKGGGKIPFSIWITLSSETKDQVIINPQFELEDCKPYFLLISKDKKGIKSLRRLFIRRLMKLCGWTQIDWWKTVYERSENFCCDIGFNFDMIQITIINIFENFLSEEFPNLKIDKVIVDDNRNRD